MSRSLFQRLERERAQATLAPVERPSVAACRLTPDGATAFFDLVICSAAVSQWFRETTTGFARHLGCYMALPVAQAPAFLATLRERGFSFDDRSAEALAAIEVPVKTLAPLASTSRANAEIAAAEEIELGRLEANDSKRSAS